MKHQSQRRPGFTLIELLTVAATVTLIASVSVPAVQDAQEAARRTRCKNNLKHLGLALHNYHDVYRSFPPGWILAYGDAASHSAYGWQSSILPFLEQSTLYRKLDFETQYSAPTELTSLGLEVYQCPSAQSPEVNELRGGYGNSNYSGNYGSEPIPRWTSGRMEAWWPGGGDVVVRSRQPAEPLFGSPVLGSGKDIVSGVFRWNSNHKMRNFTDGTSNTLMTGERSNTSGAGIWIGLQSNRFENDAVTDSSFWSPINQSFTGYSSQHGAGVNVGMGDGSVRFLSEKIDSKPEGGIFQHLADMNDGEVIPPSAFR